MKKWLLLFLAVLLLLPTKVRAGDSYTVKAGDCLSVIGQRLGINWRELARQNNIKPPYVIYPGQVLTVPAVTSRAKIYKRAAKAAKKVFFWRHPGANPYGVRNPLRALARFRITEKQRRELLRAWLWNKYGPPREVEIKSGYRLEQMINRGAKVEDNVVAKFPVGTVVKAREYVAEVDGARFILIEPYQIINPKGAKPGCYNWGWRREKIKKKPAPKPVAKPKKIPVKKLQKQLRVRVGQFNLKFKPELELALIGEHSTPIWGSGHNWFGMAIATLYLTKSQTKLGEVRTGPRLKTAYWTGKSWDGYRYRGNLWALGPDLNIRGQTAGMRSEFNAFVGFGEQNDWGHTADGRYKGSQYTRIINPELSYQIWPGDEKLVKKWEFWAGAYLDYDHSKNSSWEGQHLTDKQDPPTNKDLYYYGLRAELFHKKPVRAGLMAMGHHTPSDDAWGIGGRIYLTDEDETVRVSAGPYHTYSPVPHHGGTNWGTALEIVDVGRLLKKLGKLLSSKNKEQTKNTKEKNSLSNKTTNKNIQTKTGKQKKVNRDLSLPEEDLDEVG